MVGHGQNFAIRVQRNYGNAQLQNNAQRWEEVNRPFLDF